MRPCLATTRSALWPAVWAGRRVALWAWLAAALAGCDTGIPVERDVLPQPQPTDGFIAIAADTNGRVSLTLCLDADMTHCPSFGPLDGTRRLVVSQVPAGQYCLARIVFEDSSAGRGFTDDVAAEDTRCFDVRAGRIAYPGHLVFRTGEGPGSWVSVEEGWDKRESFEAELHAELPQLARWPVDVVRLHDRVER